MQLVEPAAGTRVLAGSAAFVEWDASQLPANVDEWEAFISIDGGRSYLSRVTPHLDAKIHRFAWTVPDLPGAEVTLLLRFGDEDEERRFVFPSRLRIADGLSRASVWTRASAGDVRAEARTYTESEEGATSWVAGRRDGSSLHTVVLGTSAMSDGRETIESPPRENSAPALTRSHGSIIGVIADDSDLRERTVVDRERIAPHLFVADILLLSRRRNV